MKLDASDIQELTPIIKAVVQQAIEEYESREAKLGDRLAFSEPEAAALLGCERHCLRDARLRGEIKARKVGKEWRYSKRTLLKFLED